MKELLENLFTVAKWLYMNIFVQLYNASFGVIGKLLDTIGYAKATVAALVALAAIAIRAIRKRL